MSEILTELTKFSNGLGHDKLVGATRMNGGDFKYATRKKYHNHKSNPLDLLIKINIQDIHGSNPRPLFRGIKPDVVYLFAY